MASISNLLKCIIIFTLLLCCQINATPINDDNTEINYDDFGELLPSQQEQFYHEQFRRASLRYHPHIRYKKASLKPLIGQYGKYTFSRRDDA